MGVAHNGIPADREAIEEVLQETWKVRVTGFIVEISLKAQRSFSAINHAQIDRQYPFATPRKYTQH
jgi:hypothetical protein